MADEKKSALEPSPADTAQTSFPTGWLDDPKQVAVFDDIMRQARAAAGHHLHSTH